MKVGAVPVITRGRSAVKPEAPSPRTTPVLWSASEERIFRHFLDALLRGDYFLVGDAAVACLARLRELPGGSMRKLSTVHNRLNVQAAAAGRKAYCAGWSKSEDRNVRRYAGALVRRSYGSTRAAIDDCLQEHERLRRKKPGQFAPRTWLAVRQRFMKAARGLGWTGTGRQMVAPEQRLYDDCASRLTTGRYRTLAEASEACHDRLRRLRPHHPGLLLRKPATIRRLLASRAHKLGRRRSATWTHEEDTVVERHALALAGGRYAGNEEAGRGCLAELRGLPGYRRSRWHHTLPAVVSRVTTMAAKLDLPRARAHWTKAEKQIVECYAQAVLAGSYAGPAQATKDCFRDHCRLITRLRTKGRNGPGTNAGRTRQAVQYQLVGKRGTLPLFL